MHRNTRDILLLIDGLFRDGLFRKYVIVLALLCTAILLIVPYVQQVNNWFVHPQSTIALNAEIGMDWDVPPLVGRINQCPTFSSTSVYWQEEYTADTPFYRPLSLTWFWLQSRLLGLGQYSHWMVTTLVMRAVFDCLFAALLWRTSRSPAVVVCSLIAFAGLQPTGLLATLYTAIDLRPSIPQDVATGAWKDQPTLFSDSLCIASLICVLSNRWLIGILLATLLILFKESGWITYALGLTLLAADRRLLSVSRWVYPSVAASIVLLISLRHAAGLGWFGGLQMGTNEYWLTRYFGAVSGSLLHDLFYLKPAAGLFTLLGVGTIAFCNYFCRSRNGVWLSFAFFSGTIVLSAALNALVLHSDFMVALEELFDPSMGLPYIGQCIVFASGVFFLLSDKRMRVWAIAFAVCSMIAAAPYVAATQVQGHALHLCYAFQSALIGMAYVALARNLRERLKSLKLYQETAPVTIA